MPRKETKIFEPSDLILPASETPAMPAARISKRHSPPEFTYLFSVERAHYAGYRTDRGKGKGKGGTHKANSGRRSPTSQNSGRWMLEMSPDIRPEWLPDGWTAVAKTTRSGATLGVNPSDLLSRFSVFLVSLSILSLVHVKIVSFGVFFWAPMLDSVAVHACALFSLLMFLRVVVVLFIATLWFFWNWWGREGYQEILSKETIENRTFVKMFYRILSLLFNISNILLGLSRWEFVRRVRWFSLV